MAGYNKVVMVGNLTRDPELKQVGAANVCRMSLASNRQYKNRQTGAIVQEVCYIDIVVWGPQADNCAQYLQKGRPVLIEGRLKFDSWKDATDGKMRSKHSVVADNVVFLGNGQMAESTSMEGLEDLAAPAAPAAKNSPVFKDEPPFDDELPF
ncbi:MAG: single-stranded DNA-binding protein [Candidatus Babeliaceae bacterium]|nr:single-stranded DNA-binding protein [Candidatus Babeliaceae bacterium]